MPGAARYSWVRQVVALLILLALWEAAGRAGMLNPLYLPSPSQIGAALVDLFSDGRIWPHLEATFTAALGGLVLGIAVGAVLGVAAALVRLIAELLEPVMTLLNAVPRVILAPLFVIWLGIGIASKIALSFILVAVLIFFTVFTGIRQVDRRMVERVITLGGDRWALVRHVYLPSVTAWILSNLKIAVGFAFTGALVGEFVAATHGLGYLLSFAQSTYNAALMFALIVLILAVVLLIFGIAGRLEKYLLRWVSAVAFSQLIEQIWALRHFVAAPIPVCPCGHRFVTGTEKSQFGFPFGLLIFRPVCASGENRCGSSR